MELFDKLVSKFSLSELRHLCFKLSINPERDIENRATTRAFAEDLIRLCTRRERLAELEAMVEAMLSNPAWRQEQTPARLPPPDKHPSLIPRDEEVAALRALLLAEQSATVGIVGAQPARRADERVVGVRGMGGIGKTMLATVLAHDETLRAHFTDGIFWLMVGEGASEASLLSHQITLARALGDNAAAFTDLRAGRVRLRELLAERCCLLLLDDVWQSDHAEPFKVLGPRGRLLLTTRDAQVLNELDATEYPLNLLGEAQALGLLAWWAKQEPENLTPEAPAIAKECGYLPLALAMVGALVGNGVDTWESVLAMLRARDLDAIRAKVGADYAYPTLWRAIEISVAALPDGLRERYADFALFPADTPIPPVVLQMLWQHEGVAARFIPRYLNTLALRSLLRKDDAGGLTLHDLQLDFVQKQPRDLPALHQRLLDAYAARCDDGWASGPDDGYFFQQLPHHLIEAGRATELAALLLDYRWLRARLHATDIFNLLGDFERLPLPLPRYHPTDHPSPGSPSHALSALQDSLQKSAHVLARDKSQLPSHLLGRLLGEPLPSLRRLLEQARLDTLLYPLTASLESPGGSLLCTLDGHIGEVRGVSLSEDGRLAVSASADGVLKLWEVATGRELQTLTGHIGGVQGVALSGDGQLAVSASADGTLKVWDVMMGRELHTLKGHTGWVLGVALSGDGRLAVSASDDRTLKVWGVGSGSERHTLDGHTGWVRAVALSRDGRLAVSASDDRTLKVWDVDAGRELHTLAGHTGVVRSVALSGDGRLAVSASADGTLKVWDVDAGRELHTLTGYMRWVWAVAVSGDGRLAVGALEDGTLKVWEVATGHELHTLERHIERVRGVALSGDGRLAVSASDDDTLKVWGLATGYPSNAQVEHKGKQGVVLSGDRQSVSVSNDRTLKVWEVGQENKVNALAGYIAAVRDRAALSGDGQMAISASLAEGLKVWEGAMRRALRALSGYEWGVNSVALSRDGRLAVSASASGTIKVWEVATGRELQTLTGHIRAVRAVALSGDGRLAISASADGTLKMWEVATGRELQTLAGHMGRVRDVALSGDGRLAVSASDDDTLKVWEVATGHEIQTLAGHIGRVGGVALSGDGLLAVSASDDGTLKVWEVPTGRELYTLAGHTNSILAVALSGDGRRLMVSSLVDVTFKVWNLDTRRELHTLSEHTGLVTSMALSGDGRLAISASADGTLKVWNLVTGHCFANFVGNTYISCCAFAPPFVVAGEASGRVHFLRLMNGGE